MKDCTSYVPWPCIKDLCCVPVHALMNFSDSSLPVAALLHNCLSKKVGTVSKILSMDLQ